MLPVLRSTRTLTFTRSGRLLPWLGPALRGLTAMRFRRSVCRQPLAEQQTRWRYCRGCPLMADCPYGQTVEPDPPPGAEVMHGQEDAARPLVIAPAFPAPEVAEPGLSGTVSVTFVGRQAARHAEAFWGSMREAGADASTGLGRDRVTFDVSEDGSDEWWLPDLPLGPESLDGSVPRLLVELTSPLILESRDERGKKWRTVEPAFHDLLRASLRSVGALVALYATVERGTPRGRLEADYAGLKTAAMAVPTLELGYRPFAQGHVSQRSGGSRLEGAVGYGVYGDVPLALVRWLVWGGRLHVGGQRVCGAGGWRIGWSDARRRPGVSDEWNWLS